jgi:hypothetical protein
MEVNFRPVNRLVRGGDMEGKREEISAICGFGLHWMQPVLMPLLLCDGTGRDMISATEFYGVLYLSVG